MTIHRKGRRGACAVVAFLSAALSASGMPASPVLSALPVAAILAGVFLGGSASAQDRQQGPEKDAEQEREQDQDRDGRQSLVIANAAGSGRIDLRVSRDWSVPQPDIVRAVVTIHGKLRDAGEYDRIAHEALAAAGPAGDGTLLVTPRFPGPGTRHPDLLRWDGTGWMDGERSDGPEGVGSFEVMDAIIAHLSERRLFPSLRLIVLVGHSAGAQFIQRYMVLARLPTAGIAVRSVIANPSSYAYFSADRPVQVGGCPGIDSWKYGLHDLPPYAAGQTDPAMLERRYVRRDVSILLGARDDDPDLRALDKSCAAEAQGATHLERGRNFFGYLQARHPHDLHQQLAQVPDVGHDARAMLTSTCALAAIYDTPACGPALQAIPRRN